MTILSLTQTKVILGFDSVVSCVARKHGTFSRWKNYNVFLKKVQHLLLCLSSTGNAYNCLILKKKVKASEKENICFDEIYVTRLTQLSLFGSCHQVGRIELQHFQILVVMILL